MINLWDINRTPITNYITEAFDVRFFFKPKHFLFMPIEDLLTTTLSQNDFLFDYFQCDVCCFKRKTLLDFWGFL